MISYKFLLFAVVLAAAATSRAADSSNGADILARHLDAIGPASARSAAKSRVVEGTTIYKILAGGTGSIEGRSVFASQAHKTRYLLKVTANTYHGEQFIFDGDHVDVAATYADKSRSELANFLRGQEAPIRDGLLGGVLSTAWPALATDSAKRFTYVGIKKVDGKDLNAFRYKPKKGSDLEILVYFDLQTSQHVRTTYQAEQSAQIGSNDIQSAHAQPTRYFMTEEFSQFRQSDGLTLPTRYTLRFHSEQPALTKEVEWDITVARILNNIDMDPRNFEIK
jgi:hypothetical protein